MHVAVTGPACRPTATHQGHSTPQARLRHPDSYLLLQMAPPEDVRGFFQQLRPAPAVARRIEEFKQAQAWDNYTWIGVHIRKGDFGDRAGPVDSFSCAMRRAVDMGSDSWFSDTGIRFFVASDDDDVFAHVAKQFPKGESLGGFQGCRGRQIVPPVAHPARQAACFALSAVTALPPSAISIPAAFCFPLHSSHFRKTLDFMCSAVLCCTVLCDAGAVVRFPHNNTEQQYAANHGKIVTLAQAAAVDLFLLSSTHILIGTFYSSYTTTAELMSTTVAFRLSNIGGQDTPVTVTTRHWCQEAPTPSSPPPRPPS